MPAPHFHKLSVRRVAPEAAGARVITFCVPAGLRDEFAFKPGQFLTIRAVVNGESVRRSYSICSSQQKFANTGDIEVGIKPVANGVFSNWAVKLQIGDTLDVMPPEGRFSPRAVAPRLAAALPSGEPIHSQRVDRIHRVGFAAGSGITPVLSIIASTLHSDLNSRFTLVYANQKVSTILFNEALQDLKDSYPARLTLIHVLSRQAQDVPLLGGRLDATKVAELLRTLLPVQHIDEAFICGPEGMIDATERALLTAGLAKERIHTERFFSADAPAFELAKTNDASPDRTKNNNATSNIANYPILTKKKALFIQKFALQIVLDGKTHALSMSEHDKVLDVALAAGLDLPYACRGGVCCTCRARVLQGRVEMVKNFTLEKWEIDKGFVLTCQAQPLTPEVTVSFDER